MGYGFITGFNTETSLRKEVIKEKKITVFRDTGASITVGSSALACSFDEDCVRVKIEMTETEGQATGSNVIRTVGYTFPGNEASPVFISFGYYTAFRFYFDTPKRLMYGYTHWNGANYGATFRITAYFRK